MHHYLDVAVAASKEAGAIHIARLHRDHDIRLKGIADLVTEVDRQAEDAIIRNLRAEFPDHAIVAEESGSHGHSEFVWYVDPLDGTTNYAHGFPAFCVSIALASRCQVLVAAVFAAASQELYTAIRGQGAWLNGERMAVSRVPALGESLVATGFAPTVRDDLRNVAEFVAVLRKAQAVRRPGSAALDLAYVAGGRLDAFWEYSLSPWDVAAGSLLVEEAGGKVTQIDGSRFDPCGRAILASNGCVHQELLAVLASTPKRHPHAVR